MTTSGTILLAATILLSGSEWGLPEGGKAFINFRDGRIFGNTGCNRFTGSYEQEGTKIKIGPLATTRMACLDESAAAQEKQLLRLLESVRAVESNGLKLIFKDDAGRELGMFQRRDWD